MAWYHTNGCSCPEGCCDCGVDYSKEEPRKAAHAFIRSLTPQDLYIRRDDADKALPDYIEYRRGLKPNLYYWEYVGPIDPHMSKEEAIQHLFTLHGMISTTNLNDKDRVDLISYLADVFSEAFKLNRSDLIFPLKPLYTKSTSLL